MKLTKAQRYFLNKLVLNGGNATAHKLCYPRTPMAKRMRDAGFVKFIGEGAWGDAEEYQITEAGRSALTS